VGDIFGTVEIERFSARSGEEGSILFQYGFPRSGGLVPCEMKILGVAIQRITSEGVFKDDG
jgi:hypothetical protein